MINLPIVSSEYSKSYCWSWSLHSGASW